MVDKTKTKTKIQTRDENEIRNREYFSPDDIDENI